MIARFFPPHPALAPRLGHFVVTPLPAGPYVLPAVLQPMLLVILRGGIRLHSPTGVHELPALSLSGLTTGPRRAEAAPGTEILCAAIKPGQLPCLFGFSAQEVTEHLHPLADLLPPGALGMLADELGLAVDTTARVAAFEHFLLDLSRRHPSRSAELVLPTPWLLRPLPELCEACGLGPRHFERRFKRSYGQSLRAFRNQLRYSRLLARGVLEQTPPGGWAGIAADHGYFDQAQLTRELRRYTSYTPAQLGRKLAEQAPALWPFRLSREELGLLMGVQLL